MLHCAAVAASVDTRLLVVATTGATLRTGGARPVAAGREKPAAVAVAAAAAGRAAVGEQVRPDAPGRGPGVAQQGLRARGRSATV